MLLRSSLDKLGPRGHTSLGNLTAAAGFALWSLGTVPASAAVLLLAPLHMERGRAVQAAATKLATGIQGAAGFGSGEVAALLSNVRTLAVMASTLALGRSYAYGTKIGRPGLVFQAAAALAVLAEVVHRSIPTDPLGDGWARD